MENCAFLDNFMVYFGSFVAPLHGHYPFNLYLWYYMCLILSLEIATLVWIGFGAHVALLSETEIYISQ